MKAKITSNDELVITAENALEAFALKAWQRLYRHSKTVKLVMETPDEYLDHEAILGWITNFGKHIPAYKDWLKENKPDVYATLPSDK